MYKAQGYKLALQHRELAVHYLTDAEGAGANQGSHYIEKEGNKGPDGHRQYWLLRRVSNESFLSETLSIRNILPMLTGRHSAETWYPALIDHRLSAMTPMPGC